MRDEAKNRKMFHGHLAGECPHRRICQDPEHRSPHDNPGTVSQNMIQADLAHAAGGGGGWCRSGHRWGTGGRRRTGPRAKGRGATAVRVPAPVMEPGEPERGAGGGDQGPGPDSGIGGPGGGVSGPGGTGSTGGPGTGGHGGMLFQQLEVMRVEVKNTWKAKAVWPWPIWPVLSST